MSTIFNRFESEAKEAAEEAYNNLKKHITQPDESGKLNDFYLASYHMDSMEKEIKDMKKELEEYRDFFNFIGSKVRRDNNNNYPRNVIYGSSL